MKKIKLSNIITEAENTAKMQAAVVSIDANEIMYNSYVTKNFHLCPKAKAVFSKLLDLTDKELLSEVTRAVKATDVFLGEDEALRTMQQNNDYGVEWEKRRKNIAAGFTKFVKSSHDLSFLLGSIETKVQRNLNSGKNFPGEHVNQMIVDCFLQSY